MTLPEEEHVEGPKKVGEGWVVTFADMMSLLMSFFVLLLSFSEQDKAKFKEVGGSLENAFGVQRKIPSYERPKGTSIIAHEFSPGKPMPTQEKEIHQKTSNENQRTLQFSPKGAVINGNKEEKKITEKVKKDSVVEEQLADKDEKDGKYEKYGKSDDLTKQKTQEAYAQLTKILSDEISEGKIEVEIHDHSILIRIPEKGHFESGDDSLDPTFLPVLDKVGKVLDGISGKITVSGHTDNLPINNDRFRSNWSLSASRAASVVNYLTSLQGFDSTRVEISAYADTMPLSNNDTEEHRRKNRRVEIVLSDKGKKKEDEYSDDTNVTNIANESNEHVNKPSPEKGNSIDLIWKPIYLHN